ncbi:hypothetical protein ODV97_17575 [Enterococcus gallinarum]|nr:hypothetical protein [Enterococcus gallinarum]
MEKKYSDISYALKRAKEVIDRQVENALLKRALGYEYTEDEYAVFEMEENEYFDALQSYILHFKQSHPEATDEDIDLARDNFSAYKKSAS